MPNNGIRNSAERYMTENDVEIVERQTAFQGYFRVDRYTLRHRLFDGGWSAPITREVFERGHSVAVLLYDPVADAIGAIEQFRAGALAAGIKPWMIECVAGIIGEGEEPEEVARRKQSRKRAVRSAASSGSASSSTALARARKFAACSSASSTAERRKAYTAWPRSMRTSRFMLSPSPPPWSGSTRAASTTPPC